MNQEKPYDAAEIKSLGLNVKWYFYFQVILGIVVAFINVNDRNGSYIRSIILHMCETLPVCDTVAYLQVHNEQIALRYAIVYVVSILSTAIVIFISLSQMWRRRKTIKATLKPFQFSEFFKSFGLFIALTILCLVFDFIPSKFSERGALSALFRTNLLVVLLPILFSFMYSAMMVSLIHFLRFSQSKNGA